MAQQDILIVDSELLTRDLLIKMLSRTGFNVHAVSEFSEAEKTIGIKKFPLAMISSKPGDKEIRKMVGKLRKRCSDCMVFLLSSPPGSYEADTLFSMGVHDVIVKPFRLEEVKLKVRHAGEILSLRRKLKTAEIQLRKFQDRNRVAVNPAETVEIPDLESLEKVELAESEASVDKSEEKNSKEQNTGSEVEKAYKRQAGAVSTGSGQDSIEQIKRLDELRKSGIITTAEFESKKKELLDRI